MFLARLPSKTSYKWSRAPKARAKKSLAILKDWFTQKCQDCASNIRAEGCVSHRIKIKNRIPFNLRYFRPWIFRNQEKISCRPGLRFVSIKNRISAKNRFHLVSSIQNVYSCLKYHYRRNFLRRFRFCYQKNRISSQSRVKVENAILSFGLTRSFFSRSEMSIWTN